MITDYLKKHHILPLYRIDVLLKAKECYINHRGFLCPAITFGLNYYGISLRNDHISRYIPKFIPPVGKDYNESWFDYDDLRRDFLDELIRIYEKDKTNLWKI